jgi:hypothetical protein
MTTCPHCGNTVPDAPYCGACGAHLAGRRGRRDATRAHAYSAFPDEGITRLTVVSSLFPQLAGSSRAPFRAAFGVVVAVLLIMAAAGLQAPVIAVSAVAVPLLFLLYVVEIDPLEGRFIVPTAVIFVTGAAVGVGWALLAGPIVAGSLQPVFAASLASWGVVRSAVLVPVIGQLLMLVPLAIAWLWRSERSEALDGFTAGATGALGLTMAATLTELGPLLRGGNLITGSSILTTLTEAVIRGISVPLVAAAATGYVGAAFWRASRPGAAGRHWLASPLLALAVALVVQVGLGFADDAALPDVVLLIVHLGAAVVALLVLRIGLHHVLLHDHREVRVGPPRVCPHCHRVVPAMPFCPNCGVAEGATGLNPVPLLRRRGGGSHPAAGPGPRRDGGGQGWYAGRPAAGGSVAVAPVPEVWAPETAPSSYAAPFPQADQAELADIRQLGHRRVLAALVSGLTLVTAVLVVLAVLLPPAPVTPCTSLSCFAPFGPVPPQAPHLYTSQAGWTVQWYPASAVFSENPPQTTASSHPDQLQLNFTNPAVPAENGALTFVGLPASGKSPNQIVTALQQANAPNAVPDYVLPGASLGYQPGYGEAFRSTPGSANGNPVTFEVVITCAERNNYAICAYAVGPQVDLARIVTHPTPSKLALSLWSDPDLNGVRWKGQVVP